jgi:hypothetical protein
VVTSVCTRVVARWLRAKRHLWWPWHCELRGGGNLARERSELGSDFNPRVKKIRAAAKPWVGARGWWLTGQRKGWRGRLAQSGGDEAERAVSGNDAMAT